MCATTQQQAGDPRTGRRQSLAERRCARPSASPLQVWLLAWLLLALSPSLALAQSNGLIVEPGGATLLNMSPREVATTVIRVTNRTGSGALFESRLQLPQGWRAITPSFPFRLAPGETSVRLVSFLVPEHTPAGDYPVRFRVERRDLPAVSGGLSLSVRVKPIYGLQIEALEVPALVIAGESFTASYRISNQSNAPLEVGFGAESRKGFRVKPAGGALSLAPGGSEVIELSVETKDEGRALWDRLSLSAQALDGELTDTVEQSIEVVPRISKGEETEFVIPTRFTTYFGGELRDGERSNGMQISWSGAGAIDDSGERFLSFMARGPDMTEETILGQREEVWLEYISPTLDLVLGDHSYWLSPLTEQGRWGRGAGVRWRTGPWEINSYHMREELTKRQVEDAIWDVYDLEEAWELEAGLAYDDIWWGNETGLSLNRALTKDWMLGVNLLHKRDNEGRSNISTLQTGGVLPGEIVLDLELGISDGDVGYGQGIFAALAHSGEALRYRVKFYQADANFKGYYRNQRYFGAEFNYQAEESPWDLRGYYRRQQLNLDLVPDLSAPLDEDLLIGFGYVWPGGDRLGLDVRHRHIQDLQPDSQTDAIEQSVGIDFSKRFAALDLSLTGNVQLGRRHNEHEGKDFDTLEYRLAGFWRPSRRATFGGYVYYNDDATLFASREKRMTAGVNAGLSLSERVALQVQAETDVLGDLKRQRVNGQLSYTRDNGHLIAVDARYDHGLYDDANLMVSYSMPIDLPVGRRTDVATVRGRIFDETTGRGFSNVVLKLGQTVAVSNPDGHFSFPAVKSKDYELKVVGGSIPTGMIPNCVLPVAVSPRWDDSCPIDLPYIEGARIAGQVQLFAPAAELLPSQTFRGRRAAFGEQPEISRDDLKPSGGIARVLVTITDGEETMRRVTNPNGDFQFVGLKPGTWTVSLLSEGLPENATAVQDSYTFELEPGEGAEANFRVEQRIRQMRMLKPLKVSSIVPDAQGPAA
jgi:hypothetical protein